MFLTVTMFPPRAVMAAKFAELGIQLKSYHEPLLRSVREVMTKSLRTNFEVGGRPPWEATSEKTDRQKGGSGILIRTGALRSAAGTIGLWKISKDEAVASGGPPYGGIHQEGWESGPARPWAVIQPQDADAIEEVFNKWIDERIARVL